MWNDSRRGSTLVSPPPPPGKSGHGYVKMRDVNYLFRKESKYFCKSDIHCQTYVFVYAPLSLEINIFTRKQLEIIGKIFQVKGLIQRDLMVTQRDGPQSVVFIDAPCSSLLISCQHIQLLDMQKKHHAPSQTL